MEWSAYNNNIYSGIEMPGWLLLRPLYNLAHKPPLEHWVHAMNFGHGYFSIESNFLFNSFI